MNWDSKPVLGLAISGFVAVAAAAVLTVVNFDTGSSSVERRSSLDDLLPLEMCVDEPLQGTEGDRETLTCTTTVGKLIAHRPGRVEAGVASQVLPDSRKLQQIDCPEWDLGACELTDYGETSTIEWDYGSQDILVVLTSETTAAELGRWWQGQQRNLGTG